MSSEVDWVLEVIDQVYGYGTLPYSSGEYGETPPLKRVDRDDSEILEGDIRKRKGDLESANFVGATHADESTNPVGSAYDEAIETVVGIRIEGLHADKYGHVDPDGNDGIVWQALKNNIRRGLLHERSYPDVGAPDRQYHTLRVTNQADQSDQYRDFFRYDFDLVFDGFETLP